MSRAKANWPALALLVLAAVFLTWGASQGEAEIIFRKATVICLECIGLG